MLTQADCLERFMTAVRAGRRGDYAAASALIERLRNMAGDEIAERAKAELWRYIKSDRKA